MKKILFFVLFTINLLCFGQSLKLDPNSFSINWSKIESAGNNLEIQNAAIEEYGRADDTLNAIYQEIMTLYAENELFIENLRAAQRAWIVYRDLHVESVFPIYENSLLEWGSSYLTEWTIEKTKLTWNRINNLYRWIESDEYTGSFQKYEKPVP